MLSVFCIYIKRNRRDRRAARECGIKRTWVNFDILAMSTLGQLDPQQRPKKLTSEEL
jgi:hypothetical protein